MSSTFEQLPYPSRAYYATHPDILATLATVFGLTPTPVHGARVLEIGCGAGGNCIPMAMSLPGASVVGVDPESHADQGAEVAARLGIGNVELRRCGVEEITASDGLFDYIICHGVLSWVPEAIRGAVFRVCSECLADNGVAAISYNTYPGWHQGEMVRRMMLFHTDPDLHPAERVKHCRELMSFLADHTEAVGDSRAQFFRNIDDHWHKASDGYLFHEYYAPANQPFYFHEFASLAAASGLEYLSEATPSAMAFDNQPPKLAEALKRCRTVVEGQQYLDFATNCRFRTSLLVHPGQPIERTGTADRIDALFARLELTNELAEGEVVTTRGGGSARVEGIAYQALRLMADVAPAAMPVRALLERFGDQLRHDLSALFFSDVLQLHTRPGRVAASIEARPICDRWARFQAEQGHFVTNSWHQYLHLKAETAALAPRLDGHARRADLEAEGHGEALEELRRDGYLIEGDIA